MSSDVTPRYSEEEPVCHKTRVFEHFKKQAMSFLQLGEHLHCYEKGIRGIKPLMVRFHETVLSVCGTSWPRLSEFKRSLDSQAELCTRVENDINKIGTEFQLYVDELYHVLQLIDNRVAKYTELEELKATTDRKQNVLSDSAKELGLMKTIQEKGKELHDIDVKLVGKVEEIQKRLREFITDHFKPFLATQAVFCKDSLSLFKYVPDIVRDFLP